MKKPATERRPRTEVIIALIGLVGVLGAALIANWDKMPWIRNSNSDLNGNLASPSVSALPQPTGANVVGCITSFLEGVSQDRLTTLEAGAKDVQVIAPQEAKDQPVAVKLEENRHLVGIIKFQFYSTGSIFKIDSIIDSECRPVNDFNNASRGGDKHVLQNYDDLQVQFGNAAYTVTFAYGAGRIGATFARISPQP